MNIQLERNYYGRTKDEWRHFKGTRRDRKNRNRGYRSRTQYGDWCSINYMLLEKSIYCNEEILKEYFVIRIKILDIYEQKVRGNLKGSTPKEQYDYYEKKIS